MVVILSLAPTVLQVARLLLPTAIMPRTPPPPPRRVLILRHLSPPIVPRYNTIGVRLYRRRLLNQQRLVRQLIALLGGDFLVSFTIENYPTRTQVKSLAEVLQIRTIVHGGDLCTFVSNYRNHIYVCGLTLLSRPLPSSRAIISAVRSASSDTTPLQYY
jgi:hypothetical protein